MDPELLGNLTDLWIQIAAVIGTASAIGIWFKTNKPGREGIFKIILQLLDLVSLNVKENKNEK